MRIGLIAMSGVRACDAELMEIGLTLPGVVERSKVDRGAAQSRAADAGRHDARSPRVSLLRGPGHSPVAESAQRLRSGGDFQLQRADARGLRARGPLPRRRRAGRLGRVARQRVAGGGARTRGCRGRRRRGSDLAGRAARRGTARLRRCYHATSQFDLAQAPMPAFELLDFDQYNRLTVQASRGCPLRCDFCAASILIAPAYRQKPAELVLAEVDRIREFWRRPFIEFADDNAFVNRRYWKRLLAGAGPPQNSLVRRNRSLPLRRRRTAVADAGERLHADSDRPWRVRPRAAYGASS